MASTLVFESLNAAGDHGRSAPSLPPLRWVGYATMAYLVLFAAALLGLMGLLGGLQAGADLAWAAVIALAPAALATVLTFTSDLDRQQYLARLVACALMLPLLVLMWASSTDFGESRVVVGLALVLGGALHMAAFVGAIFVLAARTTRVTPAAGITPIGVERLGHRFASLVAGTAVPLVAGRPGRWQLVLPAAADRQHALHLVADTAAVAQPMLHVRERLTAAGAAPQDANEASLRGLGEPAFDPSRPDAQRVWNLTLQASMIDPQRLAAVPLRLSGDEVQLPAGYTQSLDADGWLTLIVALVTTSGYGWQPGIGRLP